MRIIARIAAGLIGIALLSLAVGVAAPAQEITGRPIDLKTASDNVQKMIGLAQGAGENYKQEINALIDYTLHILRGPAPDGSGYMYALVTMDEKVEPETLLSEKVNAVWDAGQQQTLSAEARTVYSLEAYSPRYRTGGVFKNNGDTYLNSYRIEYSINGKKHTIVSEYKDWVRRNTSVPILLPGIAEWASIEIVTGVVPADVNHTLIELRAYHPVIKDNPMNPFSYTIERLKALQKNVMYYKADRILEMLDDALKGIEAVPIAMAAPLAAEQGVIQKLDYILYLFEGSQQDQEQAKKELKQLVETLKSK